MNKVILTGRTIKDIELKDVNGNAMCNFTLAVNRNFKNAQGETEADFINCVVWRKQAENLAQYVGKGSLIGVEGSIQTRNYENQEGQRVYITEVNVANIEFIQTKNPGENQEQQKSPHNFINDVKSIVVDDDLPF